MLKSLKLKRVLQMTRTINNGLIFVLFLQLFRCSNTSKIHCFSADDRTISYISTCRVRSINNGETPFNYSFLFKCDSGNEFEYDFKSVNGFVILRTNIISQPNNKNQRFKVIDSLISHRQKIYLLTQENIELNENRKVVCANGYNQVYGERFGTGTPKIYLYQMDTFFAREIADFLTKSKSILIHRREQF